MIEKPIVLVLGAGASKPYGFPIGSELKTKILADRGQGGYSDTLRESLNGSNVHTEKYAAFLNDFWKAGTITIDSFLETRREHEDAGKIAIAYALVRQEQEAMLFNPDTGSAEKWYDYLFEKMYYVMASDGIYRPATLQEFSTNKVSVITFNYDRSFEHYLFTVLCKLTNANPTEVAEVVNNFVIVHVYGQLGYLPFQTTDAKVTRSYEAGMSAPELLKAASGIKLIYERRDVSDNLQHAIDLIGDAVFVYFLGFGFHPENMRILKLVEQIKRRGASSAWYGTAFNITPEEIKYGLKRRFEYIDYQDKAILPFLRSSSSFVGLS